MHLILIVLVLILLLALLLKCLSSNKVSSSPSSIPMIESLSGGITEELEILSGGKMEKYGQVYKIAKASPEILQHLDIKAPVSTEKIISRDRIFTGKYCDNKLITDMFKAKDYIGENIVVHKKFVEKVLPKSHIFQGKRYKYHTFIKLLQAFILTKTRYRQITSFFDVCGAPGEWTRSLLKECPYVKEVYCISLADDGGLAYDKDIVENPRVNILSKNDGNLFKKSVFLEASRAVKNDVEFVIADGGFSISLTKIDYNLQSLVASHLLFCEFIYGLKFLQLNGCFALKMYDTFDDFTVSLIMIASVFFKAVYITKPNESKVLNSERYLICKGLIRKDEKFIAQMVELLDKSEKLNPCSILSSEIMEKQTAFNRSMKEANEAFIKIQTKAIYDTVNACIALEKESKGKSKAKK